LRAALRIGAALVPSSRIRRSGAARRQRKRMRAHGWAVLMPATARRAHVKKASQDARSLASGSARGPRVTTPFGSTARRRDTARRTFAFSGFTRWRATSRLGRATRRAGAAGARGPTPRRRAQRATASCSTHQRPSSNTRPTTYPIDVPADLAAPHARGRGGDTRRPRRVPSRGRSAGVPAKHRGMFARRGSGVARASSGSPPRAGR
jgi:hypothetical protein